MALYQIPITNSGYATTPAKMGYGETCPFGNSIYAYNFGYFKSEQEFKDYFADLFFTNGVSDGSKIQSFFHGCGATNIYQLYMTDYLKTNKELYKTAFTIYQNSSPFAYSEGWYYNSNIGLTPETANGRGKIFNIHFGISQPKKEIYNIFLDRDEYLKTDGFTNNYMSCYWCQMLNNFRNTAIPSGAYKGKWISLYMNAFPIVYSNLLVIQGQAMITTQLSIVYYYFNGSNFISGIIDTFDNTYPTEFTSFWQYAPTKDPNETDEEYAKRVKEQIEADGGIKPVNNDNGNGEPSDKYDKDGNYIPHDDPINKDKNTIKVNGNDIEVDVPIIGATGLGLIAMYNINKAGLSLLGQKLWSQDLVDTIVKSVLSPMESIISLAILPSLGDYGIISTTQTTIKMGNYDTEISANKLLNQFYSVNLGELKIEPFFNSFLDYSPYTSIELYLPYIGSVKLDTDDIINKVLSIEYSIDAMSGICCAMVKVDGSIHYIYEGSCAINIPLTASDFASVYKAIGGAIGAGIGAVASIATGNIAGAGIGVVSAVNSVANTKENIQKAGTIRGSAGYMSVQYPYVTITRPIQNYPQDLLKEKGKPSNISVTIGNCTGFTSLSSVILTCQSATDEEKDEITSLLKEGVFI